MSYRGYFPGLALVVFYGHGVSVLSFEIVYTEDGLNGYFACVL